MIGMAAGDLIQGRLWDLLICTIPHRHATLCELLSDLDYQITDSESDGLVGAVLYRDNLTQDYGFKNQFMLEHSAAEYVSCIDDDDLLTPHAVARVTDALVHKRPDYVGFKVRWTQDGRPMPPVEHSLRHPAWANGEDRLLRSVMQFNPVRRKIALTGRWEGGYEAERRWQAGVLAAGQCKTEAWLDGEPVYWYRESQRDTFKSERKALPASQIPPLPRYPWLTVLDAPGSV